MLWKTIAGNKHWKLLERLAREAINRFPQKLGGWLSLGDALIASVRLTEALTCLREAASRHPEAPEVHILLAKVLAHLGQYENALKSLDTALNLSPGNRHALISRFRLLVRTREPQAEGAADEIARLAPKLPELFEFRARTARPEELLEFCNAILAEHPAHTDATYYKALSLAQLARSIEACAVLSPNRFVENVELPVPPRYQDGVSFRKALANEILKNPTFTPDPRGLATRSGIQTLAMSQTDGPAINALIEQIKSAVDAYERHLTDSSYGFVTGRPRVASITFWAVIFGAKGHQISHIHSSGWLSGVFYVAAPRTAGDNDYSGPLVLGALNPKSHNFDPPWGTVKVDPKPGRLMLFPSFLPHGTLPTNAEGERICVAFDIIPAETIPD